MQLKNCSKTNLYLDRTQLEREKRNSKRKKKKQINWINEYTACLDVGLALLASFVCFGDVLDCDAKNWR